MEKLSFSKSKVEQNKSLFKNRRFYWFALGAALLVAGCRNKDTNNRSSEMGENKLLKVEMASAFPVDEANMNPEEKVEFEKKIVNFLDTYNTTEKSRELARANVILEASSDERQTKKWQGGNEELCEARVIEMKGIYYHLIDSLKKEDRYKLLSRFFNKKINTRMAVSPTHGRGVTSLTQLPNPKTGKNFTEEEIKTLTKQELIKLYDKCRYVQMNIELPVESDHRGQYKELVNILSDFSKTRILLDRSGSMDDENRIFTDEISSALVNDSLEFSSHDNKIISFSENVDWSSYTEAKTKTEIEKFMHTRSSEGRNERQLLAVEEMVKKLDLEYQEESKPSTDREASAIVMLSDEGINDFDFGRIEKLVEASEKSKITIFFALINDKSPQKLITMIDTRGLLLEFDEYVRGFDKSEYFPRDGMSFEEKRVFVAQSIKNQENYTSSSRLGVQVDENNNIKFNINFEDFKQNIRTHYTNEKEKLRSVLETNRQNYYTRIQECNDKFYNKQITNTEWENLKDKYRKEYENQDDDFRKKFEVAEENLRSLFDKIEEK